MPKIEYDGPAWNSAKKKIKLEFRRSGITRCEVGYDCCDNLALGFAHSLRRMYIATKEQMEEVILACQKCHAKLDAKKHDVTYDEVREIIHKRPRKVRSIYLDKHYNKDTWNTK
jgi:hypothetical protein